MHTHSIRILSTTCLAVVALVFAGSGCVYLNDRGRDALDMVDIGLTFSSKPQFAAYVSAPIAQVLALGYGKVDGNYFGIGEGEAALWGPHYESSVGLLVWGEELVSYQHAEAELAALPPQEADLTANFMRVGPVGFIQGPAPSLKYLVSCPHYIHVGWIGVVATPRWLQMADFLIGWTTLDVCQDDGAKRGVAGGYQVWRGIHPGGRPTLATTP